MTGKIMVLNEPNLNLSGICGTETRAEIEAKARARAAARLIV